MSEKRALFLDLDGTLANSLPAMKRAYQTFLSSRGFEGSDKEFNELNGPGLREVVAVIRKRYGIKGTEADLLKDYVDNIQKIYTTVTPAPGAIDVLKYAVSRHWNCLVVTSNSERVAQSWLKEVGLASFITSVIGMESVVFSKPDPQPYFTALKRAEVQAASSLAVEDSENGLSSAISAGIPTFFLDSHSLTPEKIEFFREVSVKQISHLVDVILYIEDAP